MPYEPNANWTAEAAKAMQAPVYYAVIDGLATHYATAPVKGTSKTVLMEVPRADGSSVDPVSGQVSLGTMRLELLDVDGAITALIATDAAGAPLASLANRKVTVYRGARALAAGDYAAIWTGRIASVELNDALTGYVLELADMLYLMEGRIMNGASDDTPTHLKGNIVNLFWAIMTGTFSVSDPNFPLDEVSTDTASSSAPTGLDVDSTLLDTARLIDARDTWHADTVGEIYFTEPEDAAQHLAQEFFRAFQAYPAVGADGLIYVGFHVPPLPAADAFNLTEAEHVVELKSWKRVYADHMNKFTVLGDWDHEANEFATTLYNTETAEDTADQSATEEVSEYILESRWMRTDNDGVNVAAEMAGRMRLRYGSAPAVVELVCNFLVSTLEQGEVVAFTHSKLPDLLTGTMGITARLLTVIRCSVDYEQGTTIMTLLDTSYKRYGVWAPTGVPNYTSASAEQQDTFAAWTDASGEMSNGDAGYRMI